MSYYVPKKNRCGGEPCMSPFKLMFGTTSNIYSVAVAARTEYKTYEDNKTESTTIVGKGEGNARKQGSGGNSYANYLARRKGIELCNCNVKK